MADLPKGFPAHRAGDLYVRTVETVGKRRTGYTNFMLLHYDHGTETYWCVPCEASDFVRTTRDLQNARQPVIRCEKCKRRWRVRENCQTARHLPHVEARGRQ